MSECIEQQNFVPIYELSEIREQLANEDLALIYKDRDLFDIFLNGCIGWNNRDPIECILDFLQSYRLDDDDKEIRLFVTEGKDKYEVIRENETLRVIIYLEGKKIYED